MFYVRSKSSSFPYPAAKRDEKTKPKQTKPNCNIFEFDCQIWNMNGSSQLGWHEVDQHIVIFVFPRLTV